MESPEADPCTHLKFDKTEMPHLGHTGERKDFSIKSAKYPQGKKESVIDKIIRYEKIFWKHLKKIENSSVISQG